VVGMFAAAAVGDDVVVYADDNRDLAATPEPFQTQGILFLVRALASGSQESYPGDQGRREKTPRPRIIGSNLVSL